MSIQAVEECIDILADKLYNGGKIKDKCEKAGFYERLTLIERQFKGASVILHKMEYLPKGFRDLWSNNKLLNVVEQFIGPNIAGQHFLILWKEKKEKRKKKLYLLPWVPRALIWWFLIS